MPRTSLLLLLSIALSAPAWAQGPPPPSDTANAMSAVILGNLKRAVRDDKNTPPTTTTCIQGIPQTAAAAAVQDIIASAMSAEELSYLDAFYSSPLGQRLTETAQETGEPKSKFTDAEWAKVAPIARSAQNRKLFEVTSLSGAHGDKLRDAVNPSLLACLPDG